MYLLAIYDIAEPGRLQKVAAIFKDYGQRVQKSKFEMKISETLFTELKARVTTVIDEEEDGIKYIPLCELCRKKTEIIGKGHYLDPEQEFVVF